MSIDTWQYITCERYRDRYWSGLQDGICGTLALGLAIWLGWEVAKYSNAQWMRGGPPMIFHSFCNRGLGGRQARD